jgi:hypothetical protein
MGKVSLNYAISIWQQKIDNFFAYEYIFYNNHGLNLDFLDIPMKSFGYFEWFYFKHSLQGGGKFNVMNWNKNFNDILKGIGIIRKIL